MNQNPLTPLWGMLVATICAVLLAPPARTDAKQEAPSVPTTIPGLTAKGKRHMPPVPDLTRGGQPDDKHDWTLGPTGARGWMWAMRLQTTLARQILVTQVFKDSPADGKLQVGDVILGIDGKFFESDARIAFGKAIGEAEKEANGGILKLTRWREGTIDTVALDIGVMGSYGKLSPFDCPKSRRIMERACQRIVEQKIGKGITGHVNALGLLATGDPDYLPLVRDYVRALEPMKDTSMSSWRLGYMNILLSEYYLLTGDKAVLPKIRQLALFFANGQSHVGTWGHGNAGANGILLGYGAMCQPSLSVAVSLQLNQKCGINDPVVAKAIAKSDIFFSTFVNKGNIPYGDGTPRNVHDSNGRSSLAVIFFDLLNKPEAYDYFARMTIASYAQREEGHTGNYWGMLWGPLGAMRAGPEATAAFLKEMRWFYDLERRWDGRFTYQGGAGMSGPEHTTPGWDTTGARVLMHAMPLRKLEITGRSQKQINALTGDKLAQTLEAGSGYSIWVREGFTNLDALDQLNADQLLKKLVTWSTPQRIRVADALARKKHDAIPQLLPMLESGDRDTILGGIYGLESQGPKSEPAIEPLVALLKSDDLWIRFRAGCALCAIGKPAREKTVPVLLQSALETSEDDPREMHQRYVAYVLWGGGVNGEPRGLIARDMAGVDHALLVPALKKLMRNTDGQTRALVARAIRMMTPEQLTPLWSDIVWAVKNPAPSGIMFNGVIRETGVETLVKHRFKEGIPLCAEYVRTMKQHGSEKRIYRVMDMLKSYGAAARPELPTLYEALEYYKENLGPGKPLPFPTWALNEFMKGLDEGIKAIEDATATPNDLRSIDDL